MATSFMVDRVKKVLGLAPADFTGTTPASTAVIDRTGFNTAFILVSNSAGTSGTLTLTFFEGTGSTAATAVTLNATPAVITADAAALSLYTLDLSGFNKNFKVTVTPALSTNHSYVSVDVLLADASIDPASGTAVTPLRKA